MQGPDEAAVGGKKYQQWMVELDARFTFTSYGGKAKVYDAVEDEFKTPTEWQKHRSRHKVVVTGVKGPAHVPVRQYWLKSWDYMPERESVVFEPGVPDDGVSLNTWRGWPLEPQEGDCELLLYHLHDIVCDCQPADYEYLMDWLAWGVQNANEMLPIGVAIKGKQGSGKSMLGDVMSRIYGANRSFIAADPSLFTGTFTEHLNGMQWVGAEEAFFVGDKKGARVLKNLITNKEMMIHPKGLTPFKAPNLMRLCITGNDEHLLDVSADERRWFVLEASSERLGDEAYYEAIFDELNAGGDKAFFHTLMTRDVSAFKPYKAPPKTKAKLEQAVLSLEGIDSWWANSLSTGILFHKAAVRRSDLDRQWAERGDLFLPTAEASPEVIAFLRAQGMYAGGVNPTAITKALSKYGVAKDRQGSPQQRGYRLRTLEAERAAFAEHYGFRNFEEMGL